MPANTCPECAGKLGVKATKCRCGWVMPGTPRDVAGPAPVVIACCYSNCIEGAICRVWTKTGWANVCRTHYPRIEIEPRRSGSWYEMDCREAYQKSYAYRRKNGTAPAAGEPEAKRLAEMKQLAQELEARRVAMLGAQPEREPGGDDADPLGNYAALERELEERANP